MPHTHPLTYAEISAGLPRNTTFQLDVFQTIPSTSTYLMERCSVIDPHICVAEAQTQGRGRSPTHPKSWISPHGLNIYLSLKTTRPRPDHTAEGLPLALGVQLATWLETRYAQATPITLKWPNDIFHNNEKLAGILVETITGDHTITWVVGVGLNVNMSRLSSEKPTTPWTSLRLMTGLCHNRNPLCSELILNIQKAIEVFEKTGLSSYQESWASRDLLKDKHVRVDTPHDSWIGTAQGINAQGHLCILDENHQLHTLTSAQVKRIRAGQQTTSRAPQPVTTS